MSFSREIKNLIWHQNEGSISGEEYFDPVLGAGSQILGYSNRRVTTAIKDQVEKGSIYLHNNFNGKK